MNCILHARRRPMINTPNGQNPPRLPLAIRQAQVRQVVERKGDVLQPAGLPVLVRGAGDRDHGDAVVLLVVGQEREELVLVGGVGAQERLVEGVHLGELVGAEHDVAEARGAEDHVGGLVEVDCHGDVWGEDC
jgi:hypothetical protein